FFYTFCFSFSINNRVFCYLAIRVEAAEGAFLTLNTRCFCDLAFCIQFFADIIRYLVGSCFIEEGVLSGGSGFATVSTAAEECFLGRLRNFIFANVSRRCAWLRQGGKVLRHFQRRVRLHHEFIRGFPVKPKGFAYGDIRTSRGKGKGEQASDE